MSERHKRGDPKAVTPLRAVLRPRDAATLIIIDRSRKNPRILMGRRRPDQVFLPNMFVFPGGRVEHADRTLARTHALPAHQAQHLKIAMKGRPSDVRATALALAAVRETFEETGFIIGQPAARDGHGSTGCWEPFLAEGFRPHLGEMAFFARAVTPPGRPRRYDTRFFLVDASAIAARVERTDGELLDVDWFTVNEAKKLYLPNITHLVMDDISALLNGPKKSRQEAAVPFYAHRRGRYERTLLTLGDGDSEV